MMMMILTMMIPVIFMLISMFFMESKSNEMGESWFECGFEPISFSRTPFSMQFFSITIVFLIFDLEIVILLPLMNTTGLSSAIFLSVIMLLLMLGLIIEWFDGSLDWII